MFSGIGGFELGIKQAMPNAVCIGNSEINKYADMVYKYNFKGSKNYGNARDVISEQLPDFDILTGGFPCQAFSLAGKRGGFEDTRGTLFYEIARIAKHKRPKLLLLENVKGLLSHNEGKTFGTILATFSELGYICEWQVLNSKNFGVPQNRERVFIIGHLREECRQQIFPITGHCGTNKGCKMIGVIDRDSQGNRVYDSNGMSITISSGGGGLGLKTGLYKTKDRIRRLTPLECERLQSYPDNFTKYGIGNIKISDNQRYAMCGNAVTVNVIKAIADKIRDIYFA